MKNMNDTGWLLILTATIAAIILSLASISFSFLFGLSLAQSSLIGLIYAFCFVALSLTEFVAAAFLKIAYTKKNSFGMMIALAMLLTCIVISILAGQATIQGTSNDIEDVKRKESEIYQIAMKERELASEKAASLSVSKDSEQRARAEKARLADELNSLLNAQAKNSRGVSAGSVASRVGDCTGSGYYIRAYCPQIDALNRRIRDTQAVIDKADAYNAALTHAASLDTKELPKATGETLAPGFVALGNLLDIDSRNLSELFFLMAAIVFELIAIGLWGFIETVKNDQRSTTMIAAYTTKTSEESNSRQVITAESVRENDKLRKAEDESVIGFLTHHVVTGAVAPTKRGILLFCKKEGIRSVTIDMVREMQLEWERQGIVERYKIGINESFRRVTSKSLDIK